MKNQHNINMYIAIITTQVHTVQRVSFPRQNFYEIHEWVGHHETFAFRKISGIVVLNRRMSNFLMNMIGSDLGLENISCNFLNSHFYRHAQRSRVCSVETIP
jgi:myosin-crossreactive antigen